MHVLSSDNTARQLTKVNERGCVCSGCVTLLCYTTGSDSLFVSFRSISIKKVSLIAISCHINETFQWIQAPCGHNYFNLGLLTGRNWSSTIALVLSDYHYYGLMLTVEWRLLSLGGRPGGLRTILIETLSQLGQLVDKISPQASRRLKNFGNLQDVVVMTRSDEHCL